MKLENLKLTQILLVNILFIILFMILNTFLCPNGIDGAMCVKYNDNCIFTVQIIINVLFSIFFCLKINVKKWLIFFVNLAITIIFRNYKDIVAP
jgi:hypothetical protein